VRDTLASSGRSWPSATRSLAPETRAPWRETYELVSGIMRRVAARVLTPCSTTERALW